MDQPGGDSMKTNCPECGTPTTERGVPRPTGWTHWRVVVPFVAVFVVMGGLAAAFWGGRMTYASGPQPSYGRAPEFVRPFFTVRELREIAAGKRESGGALARALLERTSPWLVRPPGEEYLRVLFHGPDGMRTVERNYGWPLPFVITRRAREYQDVGQRTALSQEAMDRAWLGVSRLTDPTTETYWDGRRVSMMSGAGSTSFVRDILSIDIVAMAGGVMLPVAAWYLAGGLAWVIRRKRGRSGKSVRALAAGVTALALAVLAVGWPDERESLTPGQVYMAPNESMEWLTSLTYRQIGELSKSADGDRRIAAVLLEGGLMSRGGWCLCASYVEDSARGGEDSYFDSPWALLEVQRVHRWYHKPRMEDDARSFSRRSLSTPTPGVTQRPRITWPESASSWRMRDGQLQVALPRSQPTQELRAVTIDFGGVLLGCLVVWLAWIGGRAVCSWRARVVTRRRVAANQCVVCGYSLEGV